MATFVSLKERMKDFSPMRKLMIVAGLLAALTIVISPAFQREAAGVIMETNAENEEGEDTQIAAVSAEGVTSPQAVEVESANPFIIQEIITKADQPAPLPALAVALPASVLTALLKSVISPQAP
jgi:hypothetical protein